MDESGSMQPVLDKAFQDELSKMKDYLTKHVLGNPEASSSLKNLFNGIPGVPKTKAVEKISENFIEKDFLPRDKIMRIDADNHDPKATDDFIKELLKKPPLPNGNPQNHPLVFKPLTADEMKAMVEKSFDKAGVQGETRDILREIAAELIAKNGAKRGMRAVLDVVDKLIADPEAPEIAARQLQRAEARKAAESNAEGATLAETMRKGVKMAVRPIKPVRFK